MRYQSAILSRKGHNLQLVRDPIGDTRATLVPKHHGQAMRIPMRTEWIKSEGLEMQGLWSRGVFQQVLRRKNNTDIFHSSKYSFQHLLPLQD